MSETPIDLFPLFLSLRVAVLATILAVPFGLPLAWWLARTRFAGRELVAALITLPMLLPPTVLGYYLLLLVGRQGPIGQLLESLLGVVLVFSWPGRGRRRMGRRNAVSRSCCPIRLRDG